MLTPVSPSSIDASSFHFAIVASRYNAKYVDAMVDAARAELRRVGAAKVGVIRVPGAYEIPIVAAHLASSRGAPSGTSVDAIVCLGVIIRGETTHAAHIGEAVSTALMQIQLQYHVPVIHEVLLLENEEQAKARCLSKQHNRGLEAAQTAVAMAAVMRELAETPGKGRLGMVTEGPVHKRD